MSSYIDCVFAASVGQLTEEMLENLELAEDESAHLRDMRRTLRKCTPSVEDAKQALRSLRSATPSIADAKRGLKTLRSALRKEVSVDG